MRKNEPKIPGLTAAIILAPYIAAPIAIVVAVSMEGLPRLAAYGVLGIIAVYFFLSGTGQDPLDAWRNERLNEVAPWLHRNEDIGRTATSIERFERGPGQSTGKVELDGEVWTAVCKDESEIESGSDVYIIARDGLTLEVSLNDASVPRGIPF